MRKKQIVTLPIIAGWAIQISKWYVIKYTVMKQSTIKTELIKGPFNGYDNATKYAKEIYKKEKIKTQKDVQLGWLKMDDIYPGEHRIFSSAFYPPRDFK